MASNSNLLSSSILLQCNGLVPICKQPSHSFLNYPHFAAQLGGKEEKTLILLRLGVRSIPNAENIRISIGKSCLKASSHVQTVDCRVRIRMQQGAFHCLKASKVMFGRPTAGFESECNKRHSILLSIGSPRSHQFQPIPRNLCQMGNR